MSLRILAGHAVALVVLALLPACGSRELLSNVSFSPEIISPNADGNSDVTHISYDLSRNAIVSIWLESSGGDRYTFRDARPRSAGEYGVQFSGVIDGRLLPNGEYRWIVEATDGAGQTQAVDGRLAISGGESTAPQITGFGVYPPLFTPNRDGISDRATINVSLNKPASLYVTLQNALCAGSAFPPEGQSDLDCTPYPVSEKASTREARKPGEAGLHEFDYDAGVDLGADPPPDGDYVVTARAEDAVGQVAVVTGTLAIVDGGVPRAEIVDGEVSFSARSLLIGETLYFTLTVENYSTVPIRTSGPPPGYVYDLDQNFNVPGFAEESGAWRVGIDFDTSQRNYPFRWAVGRPEDLVVEEIEGQKYYYLPSGARATITGGIRITYQPERNPLNFWAGLIHEDVEITQINNRVDPHNVTIDKP
ncbi:MAG TPA: hypothetical protein VJ793_04980 [Anaerolineae bacterium]|nr:hypothetical protein [Anaerolineae bacterium]